MSTKLVGELPASPSYRAREWSWVPIVELSGGLLTIVERRPVADDREDTYAVRADGDGFVLRNVATDVVYRCVPGGLLAGCSCPAGRYRGTCKHRTTLAAITGEDPSPPGINRRTHHELRPD